MLTLFTIPKPFEGHIGIIQKNAIGSWMKLYPKCEVLLFGSEEGTAEIAAQFKIQHIRDVDRNERGTPLVNSLFDAAQKFANHALICYVNADIILLSDFCKAVIKLRDRSFLLIGQRWDIDIREQIDFGKPDWQADLRARLSTEGKLHSPTGIDYFVFQRGLYKGIPPFAIGRTLWDNWLIYRAYASKVAVIDATKAITAIHQNHEYSQHLGGFNGIWKGEESMQNAKLMGNMGRTFTIEHANWKLTEQGLRRVLTPRHLYFRLMAIPVLSPKMRFFSAPLGLVNNLLIYFRKQFGVTRKT